MRDVERDADQRFADVGLTAIATAEPTEAALLRTAVEREQAWAATDADGQVVGFALCHDLGPGVHLQQLSVRRDQGSRGVGTALVGVLEETARVRHRTRVSLTTFADVPWNGRYYERLGYRALPEAAWDEPLRTVVAAEAELSRLGCRVVMVKRIG